MHPTATQERARQRGSAPPQKGPTMRAFNLAFSLFLAVLACALAFAALDRSSIPHGFLAIVSGILAYLVHDEGL